MQHKSLSRSMVGTIATFVVSAVTPRRWSLFDNWFVKTVATCLIASSVIGCDSHNKGEPETQSHAPVAETTIIVNQELVAKMAAAIKNALQQPKSNMANFARNMATFPSWNKSLKGDAYSVGDYVCILHKAPPLDIDADSYRWQAGLGDVRYRARIKELRDSNLSYLHSLAIYDPAWHDGAVPIPCIVITVERSNASTIPYVCAFTPDGHKNFGKSESLSSDAGMLLNTFAAVSLALDKIPERIGDAEEGFSLLKRMRNKP